MNLLYPIISLIPYNTLMINAKFVKFIIYNFMTLILHLYYNSKLTYDEKTFRNINLPNYKITIFSNSIILILFTLFINSDHIMSHDTNLLVIIKSVLVYLFSFDTYYYWSHRLFHRVKCIRSIHYVHHRAVQTLPLDYIYVHIVELLVGLFPHFILYLIADSINYWAYYITMTIYIFNHVTSHLPYDTEKKHTFIFADKQFHGLHHKYGSGGNYSLLFVFWDKIMGTELD